MCHLAYPWENTTMTNREVRNTLVAKTATAIKEAGLAMVTGHEPTKAEVAAKITVLGKYLVELGGYESQVKSLRYHYAKLVA